MILCAWSMDSHDKTMPENKICRKSHNFHTPPCSTQVFSALSDFLADNSGGIDGTRRAAEQLTRRTFQMKLDRSVAAILPRPASAPSLSIAWHDQQSCVGSST